MTSLPSDNYKIIIALNDKKYKEINDVSKENLSDINSIKEFLVNNLMPEFPNIKQNIIQVFLLKNNGEKIFMLSDSYVLKDEDNILYVNIKKHSYNTPKKMKFDFSGRYLKQDDDNESVISAGNFFSTEPKILGTTVKKETNPFHVRDKILNDIPLDCTSVSEYYENLNEEEVRLYIGDIIGKQKFIKAGSFETLIDWLDIIHLKFGCVPETLYLTVTLIKEYLARVKDKEPKNLQLIGITCFFIAFKFEEAPSKLIDDIVFIIARAYNKIEIEAKELEILTVLNFNINLPTVYNFLNYYLEISKADRKVILMANYISERILQNIYFSIYLPSALAAAAVYLALTKNNISWTDCLTYHTRYSEEHLKSLANGMNRYISDVKPNIRNTFNKYNSDENDRISLEFTKNEFT